MVLVTVAGLVLGALPYLTREAGRPIATATFVACFTAASVTFALAVHLLTYRVFMRPNSIIIRTAWSLRQIDLADIQQTRVIRTKNGPQIAVLLKDRKIIRFGCMLTGFTTLLESLPARPPIDALP